MVDYWRFSFVFKNEIVAILFLKCSDAEEENAFALTGRILLVQIHSKALPRSMEIIDFYRHRRLCLSNSSKLDCIRPF